MPIESLLLIICYTHAAAAVATTKYRETTWKLSKETNYFYFTSLKRTMKDQWLKQRYKNDVKSAIIIEWNPINNIVQWILLEAFITKLHHNYYKQLLWVNGCTYNEQQFDIIEGTLII